jgi:enolase
MSRELQALQAGWGWTGVDFAGILAASPMGHCIVADTGDVLHYLDPDMGTLTRVGDEGEMAAWLEQPENTVVWLADRLVAAARERLGPATGDEVYSLGLDAMAAGDYAHENLVKVPLAQLLLHSGDLARQLRDMPEGAGFTLRIA